jgi:hypothetical protein
MATPDTASPTAAIEALAKEATRNGYIIVHMSIVKLAAPRAGVYTFCSQTYDQASLP